MALLALSTGDVSREARYIRVVLSDRCPMPSLITESGMPSVRAADAHEWRAQ